MKFDELDARMRVFETAADLCVLPGITMVARLDGRNFTSLTKDGDRFEAPFDIEFRDAMIDTTRHVMTSGIRALFGYTQSDEISILLHPAEDAFGRKLRKFDSVLAGEASAFFARRLDMHAAFDCRISQLPTPQQVVDYFRWRQEDAHRNSLNAHCYWRLRQEGHSVRQATRILEGMSVSQKNELLFQRGVNFNDLPSWQKRGVGLVWETYEKHAVNPKTGENVVAERRRIGAMLDLPMRDQFDDLIRELLTHAISSPSA